MEYSFITTIEQLNNAASLLKDAVVIALDTETTGLDPHINKLRLIQLAKYEESVYVIDCFSILPKGISILNSILSTRAVKVLQNAKFDIKFLWSEGINIVGPIFDTMLAARILRSSGAPYRAGLGILVKHYLGIELDKQEQVSDFSGELREEQIEYAARDAAILLPLRKAMIDDIRQNHLIEAARMEFSCVYAVAEMEYTGIHLDTSKWSALTKKTEMERDAAMQALYPYIGYPIYQVGLFGDKVTEGVNPDSNKQMLEILNQNGIDVENTSKHSLHPYIDEPVVSALLKYRHAAKALSTFLYSMPHQINKKTGRLHPHYAQIGASSGRMSCGGPNIQQIPRGREFRDCFNAPNGRLMIIADYSQIELRVIAEISGDERMIDAYRHGMDLHSLTASLVSQRPIFEITKSERQAAKAVNFGLVFGMGAAGLKTYADETYGVNMSMEQAQLFRNRFFDAYKGIDAWHQSIKRTKPKESRTLSGRKHIYGDSAGLAGRYNTPVQGSAADIVKNALGILYNNLKDTSASICAAVHDEIIIECSENDAIHIAEILKDSMETAGRAYVKRVPVVVDVSMGNSWAEK